MKKELSPLVSILVPVYNLSGHLSKCLDSLCGQLYSNLQIIVVDDGSTDDSRLIIEFYAGKDVRIEGYFFSHSGTATTRNHGLEYVRGEFLLFVDGDDQLSPDAISGNLPFLISDPSLDWVGMSVVGVDNFQATDRLIDTHAAIVGAYFEGEMTGYGCSLILRWAVVKELRFPLEVNNEDSFYFAVLLNVSNRIRLSAVGTYYYVFRSNSSQHAKKGLAHLISRIQLLELEQSLFAEWVPDQTFRRKYTSLYYLIRNERAKGLRGVDEVLHTVDRRSRPIYRNGYHELRIFIYTLLYFPFRMLRSILRR